MRLYKKFASAMAALAICASMSANAQLPDALNPEADANERINIVFLGNSITYGAEQNHREYQAPPQQVKGALSAMTGRPVFVSNLGVCGATTYDWMPGKDFYKSATNAADSYVNAGGKLVFSMMLGTNDSAYGDPDGSRVEPETYSNNLKTIINGLLTAYPDASIVVNYPIWYSPNTNNGAVYLQEGLNLVKKFHEVIDNVTAEYATAGKAVYAGNKDAFAQFEDQTDLFVPELGGQSIFFLHPNGKGAARLGQIWAESIYEIVSDKESAKHRADMAMIAEAMELVSSTYSAKTSSVSNLITDASACVSCNFAEGGDGAIANLSDNNPATYFQSNKKDASQVGFPMIEIKLDNNDIELFNIELVARKNANNMIHSNQLPTDVDVYGRSANGNWTFLYQLNKDFPLATSTSDYESPFMLMNGNYEAIRLVIKRNVNQVMGANGMAYFNLGELRLNAAEIDENSEYYTTVGMADACSKVAQLCKSYSAAVSAGTLLSEAEIAELAQAVAAVKELKTPEVGPENLFAETNWTCSPFRFEYDWVQKSNAVIFDVNNDGLNDIVFMNSWRGRVYINDPANPGKNFVLKDYLFGLDFPKFCVLDYDNDGYSDLVVAGMYDNQPYMRLCHNEGGTGTFTYKEGSACGLPTLTTDDNGGNSFIFNMFSAGDFDRDGLIDLAVCGWDSGNWRRGNGLYRNNGNGTFSEVKTFPCTDGRMFPFSGSINLADVNNDGWLDVITDGWADTGEGLHPNGSQCRIYLNNEGQLFTDGTPAAGSFTFPRGGVTRVADFNLDGFLDIIGVGYTDNVGHRNHLYINTQNEISYADAPVYTDGIPQKDTWSIMVRDFNADGILDVLADGQMENRVFYGCHKAGEQYTIATDNFHAVYGDIHDSQFGIGDITGNGLTDVYDTGWEYCYKDLMSTWGLDEGWYWASYAFLNQGNENAANTSALNEAFAPSNVNATYENGFINVTWTDSPHKNIAYNVVVKTANGKIISNIPVNTANSHVSVSDGRQVCVRPGVQSYTVAVGDIKLEDTYVAVQGVDHYTEAYSSLVKAVDSSNTEIIVADTLADEVKYYNLQGNRVSNNHKGICIKVEGNKVSKILK